MRHKIALLVTASLLFLLALPARSQQVSSAASATISAASATVGVSPAAGNLNGYNACSVDVAPVGGTTFALTFEATNGGTVRSVPAYQNTPGAAASTTTTSAGTYLVNIPSYQAFDWRVTSLSNGGSVVVTWLCGYQLYSTSGAVAVVAATPIPVTTPPPVTNDGTFAKPSTTASPYYVQCVSGCPSPVPIATASPGGYPAHQRILYGNGTTYVDSAIDEINYATITSATTTQVITGVAGQYTFLEAAFYFLGSTNTADYAYLEEGSGSTCATSTKNLTQYLAIAGSNGGEFTAIAPLGLPLIIPQGYSVCAVTTGSTIYVIPVLYYTQHA